MGEGDDTTTEKPEEEENDTTTEKPKKEKGLPRKIIDDLCRRNICKEWKSDKKVKKESCILFEGKKYISQKDTEDEPVEDSNEWKICDEKYQEDEESPEEKTTEKPTTTEEVEEETTTE